MGKNVEEMPGSSKSPVRASS